ncbi:hypothetical protein B9Z55_007569 [Caenorhabditis nigoni]|uniref:Uncharacterized protein n=1 Tax=Caenorhabditis nigoni TaxID=1611254 RepID=A0A2G5VA83_9PELO|nr:hypothetical protein B9Z55_007569 [Caenorhabditis nigoni]
MNFLLVLLPFLLGLGSAENQYMPSVDFWFAGDCYVETTTSTSTLTSTTTKAATTSTEPTTLETTSKTG